jgi:L-ascorbate peroxidase
MKFHLPVFLGFLTSSQVNAFTNLCTTRSPAMTLWATSEGTEAQTVTKEDLLAARDEIDKLLREKACGPIMVRLAWHDAGTFDKNVKAEWPKAGGANASIRFEPEINHGANAGLVGAHNLLVPIKEQFPSISYADLYQMASARAIETAGGPNLGIRYGRADVESPEDCSLEGNLPDAEATEGKYGGPGGTASTEDKEPQGHLRKVFFRMGLDDEAIVALSGAHTLGRAYQDRSGLGKEKTKFTDGDFEQKFADGSKAPYTAGGSSWTEQFFVFDNSYFQVLDDENADEELLKLSSDRAVFVDEGFRPFAEKFRDDEGAFFESYAKAHKALSELGVKFDPEPIELN